MFLKSYLIIIIYILTFEKPSADTVIFRNGSETTSVKVSFRQDFIIMNQEDRKQKIYDKKDILKVRFETVAWKDSRPETREISEEERLSAEAEKGMEWVSEDEKKSPAGNGAMSIIPGFSGLYRTENYFGGALFTFMELGLLKTVIGSSVIRKTDWMTRSIFRMIFVHSPICSGLSFWQILHSLISEQKTGMKRENFRERKHLIIIRLQLLFRGCEDPL